MISKGPGTPGITSPDDTHKLLRHLDLHNGNHRAYTGEEYM